MGNVAGSVHRVVRIICIMSTRVRVKKGWVNSDPYPPSSADA